MKTLRSFIELLNDYRQETLSVLDSSIDRSFYKNIDLSLENHDLAKYDLASSSAIAQYIDAYLKKDGSVVAYGGYLEQRNIYARSAYFKGEKAAHERNIHLGLDLWCKTGTSVLSVLEGSIHSIKNNLNLGDYGPTIILKHELKGCVFYSLYGHLALESLNELKQGDQVRQGQAIGSLGDAKVNGDYAPHLHFQLILDLGAYQGDYPGVCSKNDLEFYKANCPDPNLLLKLDQLK